MQTPPELTPKANRLTLSKERFLEEEMYRATVTSKGQITIPVEVREALGVDKGTEILFVRLKNGNFELRPVTGSILDLEGIIPYDGPPVSIEEMNEAIGDAVVESYLRSVGEA